MQDPFFIVGCGRSGTTLLRVMLNLHRDLAIPMESLFLVDYLRAGHRVSRDQAVALLLTEYELKEWKVAIASADLAGVGTIKQAIDRIHEIYTQRSGKRRWGQKTPRFVRYGPLLKENYPQARFIHVVRDARAVASSLIRSPAHRSNAYYAARRWCRDVQAGLALERRYPADTLRMRFEDLVQDPETCLRTTCAFLHADYDARMQQYHVEPGTTDEYGAYYGQVHAHLAQPPDPGRIDAWREHLASRQVELIEAICGPLQQELGYAVDHSAARIRTPYVLALQGQRWGGLGRQAAHSLRTRGGFLRCWWRRKMKLGLYRDLLQVHD